MGKYKFKLKEAEVGDVDISGGKKSTITDIDPETGRITWDVESVPDFESTYDIFLELRDYISKLSNASKDKVISRIKNGVIKNFNDFRTHLRKNYPEEYKVLKESGLDLDESSSTGGAASFTPGTGAQYATPFAFKLKNKNSNSGYRKVKEGIGATLGPGPAAGDDGVKDNAYVEQFKYKLVPKDSHGNYVQKGSDLEVKNIFEEEEETQTPSSFHQERMSGFDRIGDLLGQINPLLNDAKIESEKFYKENPQTYTVLYGTDLIVDYLNDIISILKEKE